MNDLEATNRGRSFGQDYATESAQASRSTQEAVRRSGMKYTAKTEKAPPPPSPRTPSQSATISLAIAGSEGSTGFWPRKYQMMPSEIRTQIKITPSVNNRFS